MAIDKHRDMNMMHNKSIRILCTLLLLCAIAPKKTHASYGLASIPWGIASLIVGKLCQQKCSEFDTKIKLIASITKKLATLENKEATQELSAKELQQKIALISRLKGLMETEHLFSTKYEQLKEFLDAKKGKYNTGKKVGYTIASICLALDIAGCALTGCCVCCICCGVFCCGMELPESKI